MARDNSKHRISSSEKERNNRFSRKKIAAVAVVTAIVVLAAIIVVLYVNLRKYDDYTVRNTLDLTSQGESVVITEFADGYLKCGSSGLSYFNKKDVVWEVSQDFTQPLFDCCGDFAAAAETKGKEIIVFDTTGLLSTFSVSHSVTDVSVSKYGAIAVSTNDGDVNYVEMYNSAGEQVLTIRTVFSASGYLSDIDLSEDGMKLAAAFIGISEGNLASRVLFYDFSVSDDTSEYMVGGFNQYNGMVVTNVEFMRNNVVCAVADSGFSLYDFSSDPALIYEDLDFEWEIQTLFHDDKYVGFILNDESSEYNYEAKIYDMTGASVMDSGFDFAYSHASLSGRNLLLYSSSECRLYDFKGTEKILCSFPEHVSYMFYMGRGADYILAASDSLEFIRLK